MLTMNEMDGLFLPETPEPSASTSRSMTPLSFGLMETPPTAKRTINTSKLDIPLDNLVTPVLNKTNFLSPDSSFTYRSNINNNDNSYIFSSKKSLFKEELYRSVSPQINISISNMDDIEIKTENNIKRSKSLINDKRKRENKIELQRALSKDTGKKRYNFPMNTPVNFIGRKRSKSESPKHNLEGASNKLACPNCDYCSSDNSDIISFHAHMEYCFNKKKIENKSYNIKNIKEAANQLDLRQRITIVETLRRLSIMVKNAESDKNIISPNGEEDNILSLLYSQKFSKREGGYIGKSKKMFARHRYLS
jgi:hypothetical protein